MQLKVLDVPKKKAVGKRRGPKPKPPDQVRHVPITFVVTPAERERLGQAADAASRPLADFVRDAALGRADRKLRQAGE